MLMKEVFLRHENSIPGLVWMGRFEDYHLFTSLKVRGSVKEAGGRFFEEALKN